MSNSFVFPAVSKTPGPTSRTAAEQVRPRFLSRDRVVSYARRACLILTALVIVAVAYLSAVYLLSNYTIAEAGSAGMLRFVVVVVVIKGLAMWHFGVFRSSLRYAGIPEFLALAYAQMISGILLFLGAKLSASWFGFPGLLFTVDGVIAGASLAVLLFSARVYNSERARRLVKLKKVVIIGAGDGGASILRQLLSDRNTGVRPIALIDDDPAKRGTSICGVLVAGDLTQLRSVVSENHASEIFICIPSATRAHMSRILSACRQCQVPVRTLPTLRDLVDGSVSLRDLQRIRIEDILQRDRISPDPCLTKSLLSGKTVLVTGAGGSIGSELCLQIAGANPKCLILVDKSENSLFYSHLAIAEKYPRLDAKLCLADITDLDALRAIFQQDHPEIVFHAAAFKHVGMMQLHPHEAIRNNVLGTRNVALLSLEIGVERFVNISTDKSVNPHCYMGLSKKLAELTVKELGEKSRVKFLNVRFGNVAGSAGSVLRLFKEQIKNGGPIRVTDPRATRFFMSIPEAVYLVLCAAARGKDGETYIFDMGDPINIYQLARTMSLFSGYAPEEELPIQFIGLRDGEKFHEELWESWERPQPTENPLLFVLKGKNPAPIEILKAVQDFENYLTRRDYEGLIEYIDELVPSFAQVRIPHLEVQDYSLPEVQPVEMRP